MRCSRLCCALVASSLAGAASLPVVFEPNRGQADSSARFVAHSDGADLLLDNDGAVLRLRSGDVRMRLSGARRARAIEPVDPLPGLSSYFIGNDPALWRSGIPQYGGLRYRDVYPGIDLVFHGGSGGQFEYDFEVAPGADPSVIGVRMEGAQSIRADGSGGLELRTTSGPILEPRPRVYQDSPGGRKEIAGALDLARGDLIRFRVGAYDRTRPLVIDPVVQFQYNGPAVGKFVATDPAGNVYITDSSSSSSFPQTVPSIGPAPNPGTFLSRGFVSKLSPDLKTLLYSVRFGGSVSSSEVGGDFPAAIQVNAAGNAFVTGRTDSKNFPTMKPVQGSLASVGVDVGNAFVLELDPTGSHLVFSTYLGGESDDSATAITLDKAGAIYIAGATSSPHFPTTTGALNIGGAKAASACDELLQEGISPEIIFETVSCRYSAFVAKLSSDGSTLLYAARFGGSSLDVPAAIATDAQGDAFITGGTESPDFPTTPGAFQRTSAPLQGCMPVLDFSTPRDSVFCLQGFVSGLNPAGTGLVFSTYFGGQSTNLSSFTWPTGIALDAAGNVYIAGGTTAADLPTTAGAVRPGKAQLSENFAAALNHSGSAVIAATYLGGNPFFNLATFSGRDAPFVSIAALASGTIGVAAAGEDNYVGVPPVAPNSPFIVFQEFDPLFQSAVYTYTGPPGAVTSLAAASDGSVTMSAISLNQVLGTPGFEIPFITRLTGIPAAPPLLKLAATAAASAVAGADFTYAFAISNNGPGPATNVKTAVTFSGLTPAVVSAAISTGSCAAPPQISCAIPSLAQGASATITVHASAPVIGAALASVSVTSDNATPQSAQVSVNIQPPPGALQFALPLTKPAALGAPIAVAIASQNVYALTSSIEIFQGAALSSQPSTPLPAGAAPAGLIAVNGNLIYLDGAGSIAVFASGATLQTLPANANPTAMTALNLGGGPQADLAVIGDSGISLFTANGDGTYSAGAVFDISGRQGKLTAVAAGSFTGAALDDLVAADASGAVWLLASDGMGGFGSPTRAQAGGNPVSLAVADFDGDGNLDVAAANSGSGSVSVLLGDGAGNLASSATIGLSAGPSALVAADFNGDGIPDLAAALPGQNAVALLRGSGGGKFAPPLPYAVGTQPVALAVGNVSGAPNPDLAVANRQSRDLTLLLNRN